MLILEFLEKRDLDNSSMKDSKISFG